MRKADLTVEAIKQEQSYPFSNHLYWLAEGKKDRLDRDPIIGYEPKNPECTKADDFVSRLMDARLAGYTGQLFCVYFSDPS